MLRRNIEPAVEAALSDTPVVLINGARQTGKTTLAQALAARHPQATYVTLDDAAVLAAATHDPRGFIEDLGGLAVIDEVQRAPGLFPAIKLNVDRDRRPGRFLLTGSANVLALPALAESLAGRMEIVTLHPFSQGELQGSRERFIDTLFEGRPLRKASLKCSRGDLSARIHKGGYPEMLRRQPGRRTAWFASYLTTILQREVRDLSNIEGLTEAPRLVALLAARSAGLLNMADLSRDAGIPYSTLQRYLSLFEATFLIRRIPAWSANLGKRLVKAAKPLLGDTGFMAYLLNVSEANVLKDSRLVGRFLETFVGCELQKQIEWSATRPTLLHYRTGAGAEVDYVLEAGARRIVGVEVKTTASPGAADFRGLASLAADTKGRFVTGVLLYTGDEVVPFGDKLWAVPIGGLWAVDGVF